MSRQNHGVHVCSFSAVDMPKGANGDYATFRRAVLKAGRFSVFEATETQIKAQLFTQLCNDATVVTDNSCGFPWTNVRAA